MFGRFFGRDKDGASKPTVVKLPEGENKMYFCPEKKRWRVKGEEHLEKEEEALAPPPKMEDVMQDDAGPPPPGGSEPSEAGGLDAMVAPPSYGILGRGGPPKPAAAAVPGGLFPGTAPLPATGAAPSPFPAASPFGGTVSKAANPHAPRAFGTAEVAPNPHAPRGPKSAAERRSRPQRPQPKPVVTAKGPFGASVPAYSPFAVPASGGADPEGLDPEGVGMAGEKEPDSSSPPTGLPAVEPPAPKDPEPLEEDKAETNGEPVTKEPAPPPAAAANEAADVLAPAPAPAPGPFPGPFGAVPKGGNPFGAVAAKPVNPFAPKSFSGSGGPPAPMVQASPFASSPFPPASSTFPPAPQVAAEEDFDAGEAQSKPESEESKEVPLATAAAEPEEAGEAVTKEAAAVEEEAPREDPAPEAEAPEAAPEDAAPPDAPATPQGETPEVDTAAPEAATSGWDGLDDLDLTTPRDEPLGGTAAAPGPEEQPPHTEEEEGAPESMREAADASPEAAGEEDAAPAEAPAPEEAGAAEAEETQTAAVEDTGAHAELPLEAPPSVEETPAPALEEKVADAWGDMMDLDFEDAGGAAVAEDAAEPEAVAAPKASSEAPAAVEAVAPEEKVNDSWGDFDFDGLEEPRPMAPAEDAAEPEAVAAPKAVDPWMANDPWAASARFIRPRAKVAPAAPGPAPEQKGSRDSETSMSGNGGESVSSWVVLSDEQRGSSGEHPDSPTAPVAAAVDSAAAAAPSGVAVPPGIQEEEAGEEASPSHQNSSGAKEATLEAAVGAEMFDSVPSPASPEVPCQATRGLAVPEVSESLEPVPMAVAPSSADEELKAELERMREEKAEMMRRMEEAEAKAAAQAAEMNALRAKQAELEVRLEASTSGVKGSEEELAKKDQAIAQKDLVLAQKDAELSKKEEVLAQKDAELSKKEEVIAQKDEEKAGMLRRMEEAEAKAEAQAAEMNALRTKQASAFEFDDSRTEGDECNQGDEFELPDFVWSCGDKVMQYVKKLLAENSALKKGSGTAGAIELSSDKETPRGRLPSEPTFTAQEVTEEKVRMIAECATSEDTTYTPLLVDILRERKDELNVCASACSALELLTFEEPASRMTVANCGVEALLNVMARHQDSGDLLLLPAVETLWNVTFQEQSVVRVTDAGGIDMLLAILQSEESTAAVLAAVCGVLLNLAALEDSRNQMVHKGIVGAVSAAMRRHPEQSALLEQGSAALYMFSYLPELKPFVLAAEGDAAATLAVKSDKGTVQRWGTMLQEVLAS